MYFKNSANWSNEQKELAIELYNAEVLYHDEQIANLLNFIKSKDEKTIVVFSSDHGEELYDSGKIGHGYDLNPSQVRVPLAIGGIKEKIQINELNKIKNKPINVKVIGEIIKKMAGLNIGEIWPKDQNVFLEGLKLKNEKKALVIEGLGQLEWYVNEDIWKWIDWQENKKMLIKNSWKELLQNWHANNLDDNKRYLKILEESEKPLKEIVGY